MSKYAWGGERIRLESLAVPPSLQGAALTLVAADADSYVLRTQAQEELLRGRVGELAQKGDLKVFVSELKARPGTEFVVRRVSREQAMDALRAASRLPSGAWLRRDRCNPHRPRPGSAAQGAR